MDCGEGEAEDGAVGGDDLVVCWAGGHCLKEERGGERASNACSEGVR